ncbi:ABC transporter ATP-binding protein [Verrucomicrobiota bacterium]
MIELSNISIHIGTFVLKNISLKVSTGKYAVLMGRSGSGKTTILEAVCGLHSIESGNIVLMDRQVAGLSPAERGVGYVPQDRALFSRMTVKDNIAFAMNIRGSKVADVNARVAEITKLLGIEDLLDRMPQGLSGGEAQRVALGRALSHKPSILLLDEPLSALDEEIREDMRSLLKSVQKYTGVTILHVTHSSEEAKKLADCTFVLTEDGIEEKE